MTQAKDFTLAELLIVACAETFRGDGERLVTGIGPLPRVAAGLAKLTFEPGICMTDGEAYLVEEPIPIGPRGDFRPKYSGWMPYSRVFDSVWSGRRHALVTPVQVDRWAQANISALGTDFARPKVQMLGVRGFPGNSICHRNSMLLPKHSTRVFVEGQVDVVASVGYRQENWPAGTDSSMVDIGRIITDLCVFDFKGEGHSAQVLSLHPGVSLEEVQQNTGFPIVAAAGMTQTSCPTEDQMAIIRRLDPHDIRASVLKGNPPGRRAA